MKGKETITMCHEGGKTRKVEYVGINQKVAQCWVSGGCGTYDFRLTNGECKTAPNWFLKGEDLELVREDARSQGVKFSNVKRIPLRDKGKNKAPRKQRERKVDPRQGEIF